MRPIRRPLITLALTGVLLPACAPLPPTAGVAIERYASANFDARKPNFVIIHHTSDADIDSALRTLTEAASRVSSHYLIGRDGRVLQLVDEQQRAWHAGVSSWGSLTDLNSASIGIELDNDGETPFAVPQIDALIELLRDLTQRYGIPPANVLGHGDIAPQRKSDPSRHFPWQRLAAAGFGLWCEPPWPAAPAGFDWTIGLQALGYDVADAAAATAAFERHFVAAGELQADARLALLYCLVVNRRQ